MKAKVYPGSVIGEIYIPPSKSMAHRAVICAALSNGISRISNIAYSDDISATIDAMRALGAKVEEQGSTLTVEGVSSVSSCSSSLISCKESGSTLRFIIPLFSLTNEQITFVGENRLMKRPQKIYEGIFKNQNLFFMQNDNEITIKGALKPQTYEIDGSVSSQFISGLLFTLPLLCGKSTVKIIPPFESSSYINLTLDILEKFGIEIIRSDEYTFEIDGNQAYKPCDYVVEGDYSQLAFPAVLAAVNHDLTIRGVNKESRQGDKAIIDILRKAGVDIKEIDDGYIIHKSKIKGISVDLSDCPDIGPILMILGMFCGSNDTFHIYNANRLRIKESDRIAAMQEGINRVGGKISSDSNEIFIKGGFNYHGKVSLNGAKDHRIVMSFAVLATMLDSPIAITSAEAISKSYPNFFDDLINLNVKVELLDD